MSEHSLKALSPSAGPSKAQRSTRTPLLPDAPTMAEAGVPGFDISTWYGLFVPASTPDKILNRLNKVITDALKTSALKERLARLGGEAAPCSSADFAKLIQSELTKYAEIVKISGARVD